MDTEEPKEDLSLHGTIVRFHKTIAGIRDLLQTAEPHLARGDGTRDPELILSTMDGDQKAAVAVVIAHFASTSRGTSRNDQASYESAPRGEGANAEDDPLSDNDGSASSEAYVDARPDPEPVQIDSADTEETGYSLGLRGPLRPEIQMNVTPEFRPAFDRAVKGALTQSELNELLNRAFGSDLSALADFFAGLRSSESLNPDKMELLNGAMLVTAVAAFETLLGEVFGTQIRAFPALLDSQEKQFSLEELEKFGSIEDARTAAIDQRVDSLMRESFDGWERWLEKRAGLILRNLCMDYGALYEVVQRRHVVVHSAGRASRQYLSSIKPSDVAIGDPLSIDSEYLDAALDELDVLGVALATQAWSSWATENSPDALRALNSIAYELLDADRFGPCIALCNVAEGIPGEGWVREATRVNSWIARKQRDGASEIREVVDGWDTTALAPEFALARAALLDDLDEVFDMLPALLESGVITLENLREWPLFRETRADSRYSSVDSGDRDDDDVAQPQPSPSG